MFHSFFILVVCVCFFSFLFTSCVIAFFYIAFMFVLDLSVFGRTGFCYSVDDLRFCCCAFNMIGMIVPDFCSKYLPLFNEMFSTFA